ncbi:Denticleless -like protein [Sarcoptes scabiei]|uniref:Denticleless -like protein n=1 Tax=Sarcoptes scabiei TaxID=52283 RepID=A0A834R5T1_SARSC|nr:Denticleless -like protein [Sarcoptes scabiei]
MNIVSLFHQRQYGLSNHYCPAFRQNSCSNHFRYLPSNSFRSLQALRFNLYSDNDLDLEDSPLTTFAKNRNGLFVIATDYGHLNIIDDSFRKICNFDAHCSAIFDVQWHPDQESFLTAAGDRSIALWNTISQKAIYSLQDAHDGSVKKLSFQTSNVFASGGRDGSIKLWDLRINAIKPGPVLMIPDSHIQCLPPISNQENLNRIKLTPRQRSRTSIRNKKFNNNPSNVVTCVQFHPNNTNLLFSSGVSDAYIKVWDVRSCCRRYQCNNVANPNRFYSSKNIQPIRYSHGYSHFIFNHSSNEPVLFASSGFGLIYAFKGHNENPITTFSGHTTNSQTKIASFGDDYLLCGGSDGIVSIWNCQIKSPACAKNDPSIVIENRKPIYSIDTQTSDEVPCVLGDFESQNIYIGTPYAFWKCSFAMPPNEIHKVSDRNTPNTIVPIGESDRLTSICSPYDSSGEPSQTFRIDLKRSSSFKDQYQSSSKIRPLTSITNWFNSSSFSETKRLKSNEEQSSFTSKRSRNSLESEDVHCDDLSDIENRKSKSTSHKNDRLSLRQKSKEKIHRNRLKRDLFNNNRKIKDYFAAIQTELDR